MLQQKAINQLLRRAVHLALTAGVALPVGQAVAQDQETPAADIGTVTVTGSRIRRVDSETASPVYTLGEDVIHQSGVTTIGDLLQEVPSVAGAATNPQVNNGGGTGASHVELRGLDTERTLVLLNGRRIGALTYEDGAVDAADYVIWRKHLGTNFQLPNEVPGTSPDQVTVDDYNAWRARFGATSGAGAGLASAQVPEPGAFVYLVVGAGILLPCGLRARSGRHP